MVHSPSIAYVAEKNKRTNRPVWLFRIHMDPAAPASDIFLAQWDADVPYYRTDGGVNTAATYIKFPCQHEGLRERSTGEVDAVTITTGNVSREMAAYLELNDGLRGKKVTIRQTFMDQLADAEAYQEYVYWIEAAEYNRQSATLRCSTRLSILDVQSPGLRYTRNHCVHKYKGRGCWIDDGDGTFSMPVNFSTATEILLLTAGQELKSLNTVDYQYAILSASFATVDCLGMSRDGTDYLKIDLKATGNIGGTNPAKSQLGISDSTNSWHIDPPNPPRAIHSWYITAPHAQLTSSWQTFTFNLDGFSNYETLNIRAIKRVFWTEVDDTSPYSQPTLYLRNPKIFITATATQWTDDASTWSAAVTYAVGKRCIYAGKVYAALRTTINDQPDVSALDWILTGACNYTLVNCRRHNNTARFGAFPGIPLQRVFNAR